MKTQIELYKQIVQKQDELERLRVQQLANIHARNYYNTHDEEERLLGKYFELNNRVKLLIPEIVSLRQQLEKAQESDKELAEIREKNNCNNCTWGICLTKDWPCNDCNGISRWEPIKPE
jgi:uncharacterized small protein (DUF1192 family)